MGACGQNARGQKGHLTICHGQNPTGQNILLVFFHKSCQCLVGVFHFPVGLHRSPAVNSTTAGRTEQAKFRHNFDTDTDTEHFLLLCISYNEPRSDLLSSLNAILLPHGFLSLLLKFILYDDERLTIDTNKKLLQATLKSIHASEHFSIFHCCTLPHISIYLPFVCLLCIRNSFT